MLHKNHNVQDWQVTRESQSPHVQLYLVIQQQRLCQKFPRILQNIIRKTSNGNHVVTSVSELAIASYDAHKWAQYLLKVWTLMLAVLLTFGVDTVLARLANSNTYKYIL